MISKPVVEIRRVLSLFGIAYFYANRQKDGSIRIGPTRNPSEDKILRMLDILEKHGITGNHEPGNMWAVLDADAVTTWMETPTQNNVKKSYKTWVKAQAEKWQPQAEQTDERNHHPALRTKKTQITLNRGERIIAVVPEYVSGPGWSNTPLWVYIECVNGIGQKLLRTECIQPGDQNYDQFSLFKIAAQVHKQLVESVVVRQKK